MGFPKGFLWGAATSAYQVEGGNNNDWTQWEKGRVSEAVNLESQVIWPRNILSKCPFPVSKENYICGAACDHYRRYKEDLRLAESISLNSYRFSIEWSRVEPRENCFDGREIEHYRRVIREARKRGMEPFITLWHFTLPIWISKRGGWEHEETVNCFIKFVQYVVGKLADQNIKYYITMNEPNVYAALSYINGVFPPQKRSLLRCYFVLKNLANAHKSVYKAIKDIDKCACVGIAQNIVYYEAYNKTFVNRMLKQALDSLYNFYFLDKIKNYEDFIGVNLYMSYKVNFIPRLIGTSRASDLGWGVYPRSICLALKSVWKYKKPIYITENGIADNADSKRADFIRQSLKWVRKANDLLPRPKGRGI